MTKITIHFKNGTSIRLFCEEFEVETRGGSIVSMTWKCVSPPLYLDLHEIICIEQEPV